MDSLAPWVEHTYQLPSLSGLNCQLPLNALPAGFKPLKLLLSLVRSTREWGPGATVHLFMTEDWGLKARHWHTRAPEIDRLFHESVAELDAFLVSLSALKAGECALFCTQHQPRTNPLFQVFEYSLEALYPSTGNAFQAKLEARLKELRGRESTLHLVEGESLHLQRIDPYQIENQHIQADLAYAGAERTNRPSTLSYGLVRVPDSKADVQLKTYNTSLNSWNEGLFFKLFDYLFASHLTPELHLLTPIKALALALNHWSKSRNRTLNYRLGTSYLLPPASALLKVLLERKQPKETYLYLDEDLNLQVGELQGPAR